MPSVGSLGARALNTVRRKVMKRTNMLSFSAVGARRAAWCARASRRQSRDEPRSGIGKARSPGTRPRNFPTAPAGGGHPLPRTRASGTMTRFAACACASRLAATRARAPVFGAVIVRSGALPQSPPRPVDCARPRRAEASPRGPWRRCATSRAPPPPPQTRPALRCS